MNWELIKGWIAAYFGGDQTALAAALHELELSQDPAYLDAILAEEGSPIGVEEAIIWWSKRRGDLWRS